MNILHTRRSGPSSLILSVIRSLENRFGVNETVDENRKLIAVYEWLKGVERATEANPEEQYVVVHNRNQPVVRIRLEQKKRAFDD